MKTKDKIIQGAIELFNSQGERNVSTNHIAAHLGISPGNLYYHYRNKDDIIRSIYKLYEKNLDQMFQPQHPDSVGMDEMMYYVDRVFYSMWRFRFLYANLPDILARDNELHQRYLVAQKRLYQRMITSLQEMREQEYISLDDEMINDLAHTLKLVVTFWISYQHTQTQQEITQSTISEGVLKVICIFKGYLSDKGRVHIEEIEKNYRELMKSDQVAPAIDY
jgi:AcrR family transcriptional regulator